MFIVVGTETFNRKIAKWPKTEKIIVRKIIENLSKDSFAGKPLTFNFLREKKIRERRIYYLVYVDLRLVLMVAISDKKSQQATIEHIKHNLGNFKKEAEKIIKQVS